MKTKNIIKSLFHHTKRLLALSFAFLFILTFLLFGSCKHSVNYFDYVSEFRNNIFLAETENICLRIYSVQKESPYAADGIANESTARTEIFLNAPTSTQNYAIYIKIEGTNYGGELSYDNVKAEYFLSFSLNVSEYKELPCLLSYEGKEIALTAISVLCEETISAKTVLDNVQAYEPELFASMTDKYGFKGEIYLRLLYEDAPYYYVGIIKKNGDIYAFLVNATNGKVLARRNP